MHAANKSGPSTGILVVEDEELTRIGLSRMLALKFPAIPIYTAENGVAALELYRRHLPGLVLTDLNMPQLNGMEMARSLRAEAPEVTIIALSAHSDDSFLLDAVKSGIDYYMVKPIDRQELFDVVGRWLELRPAGG